MSIGPIRKWPGVITPHARSRYIQRITSPEKYPHLRARCRQPSCPGCISEAIQLQHTLKIIGKYIDIEIRERIWEAQDKDWRVKNPSFLEVIERIYPPDRNFGFWQFKNAVFVIAEPPDEPWPVLLTVMSVDMIDGLVINKSTSDELTVQFDRWKHEARMRNQGREIRNL